MWGSWHDKAGQARGAPISLKRGIYFEKSVGRHLRYVSQSVMPSSLSCPQATSPYHTTRHPPHATCTVLAMPACYWAMRGGGVAREGGTCERWLR